MAFAPRGVSLADFIPSAVAAEPPTADAGPHTPEPPPRKGCRACATGGDTPGFEGALGTALMVAALARRRRR